MSTPTLSVDGAVPARVTAIVLVAVPRSGMLTLLVFSKYEPPGEVVGDGVGEPVGVGDGEPVHGVSLALTLTADQAACTALYSVEQLPYRNVAAASVSVRAFEYDSLLVKPTSSARYQIFAALSRPMPVTVLLLQVGLVPNGVVPLPSASRKKKWLPGPEV